MKILFQIALFLIFAAGFACAGAALENHRTLEHAKAQSGDPLSIIGVAYCKQWLGVIGISKDGVVHAFPGVSPDAAQAMSKTLPDANSGLIHVPCGAGDTAT
jgi:hypothetical protein